MHKQEYPILVTPLNHFNLYDFHTFEIKQGQDARLAKKMALQLMDKPKSLG